jgi:hypothetical protein
MTYNFYAVFSRVQCMEGLPSAFERIDAMIFILPEVQHGIFAHINGSLSCCFSGDCSKSF